MKTGKFKIEVFKKCDGGCTGPDPKLSHGIAWLEADMPATYFKGSTITNYAMKAS